MCPFVIEDLFAAGLGFDIAGAYLLTKAFLLTPAQIAALSANSRAAVFDPPLMISRAGDKIDGRIGFGALFLGFGVQALAYAITLGGRESSGSIERGVTAAAICIAAAGLILIAWKALRTRLWKRELIAVAHIDYTKRPVEVQDKPYGATLSAFGQEMGYEWRDGESPQEYVKRVFGVDVGPELIGPNWI